MPPTKTTEPARRLRKPAASPRVVNPFGAGFRPWTRKTLAKLGLSATVYGVGEFLIDDAGHAYVPDGTTQAKNLSPLLSKTAADSVYVSRVGLFTAASGTPPTVPAGITVAATEGYSTVGKGAATYIHDAAVNGAYVTANPRASFLAADGRGFRLNPHGVSPFMFGAAGDAVISTNTGTDDAVPLQAWAAFIAATDCNFADAAGSFLTSAMVTLSASATKNIRGRFVIVAKAGTSGVALVKCDAWPDGYWETIVAEGTKGITSDYSTKTWQAGVWVTNGSSRTNFGRVSGGNFAFSLAVSYGGNNSVNGYGVVKAHDCGSGVVGGATHYGQPVNWSSPVNSGSSGSTAQTCVITVDSLPPAWVQSGTFGAVGSAPYMIRVTNSLGATRLHFITAVDAVNSKLTIFPWVNPADTPATSDYVWGGGLYLYGSDSNVTTASVVDAGRCGSGLVVASLYGPVIERLVTQSCGAALVLGQSPSSALLGTRVGGYFEANIEDVIYLTRPGGTTVYNWISSEYALTLSKCYVAGAPRFATTFAESSSFQGFQRTSLAYRGDQLRFVKNPFGGGASSTQTIAVNRSDQQLSLAGNTFTINATLDIDLHRLTGIDTLQVAIVGTGTNDAPTGTITFPAPSGYTINGGAGPVTFTGLTAAARFVYRFDTVALNVVVTNLNTAATQLLTKEFSAAGLLAVTTGNARWYAERAMTILGVRANLGTAPASTALLVDVNINGTTIFTTQARRPTVAVAGFTSGAVTNPNITAVSVGDYFTVDIDQVDTTMTDLVVQLLLSVP